MTTRRLASWSARQGRHQIEFSGAQRLLGFPAIEPYTRQLIFRFFVKCTVIFYSIGLFHVVPGVTKCGDCKLTCGD